MVTQQRRLKALYLAYLRGDAPWEDVVGLLESEIAERERRERVDSGDQGTSSAA